MDIVQTQVIKGISIKLYPLPITKINEIIMLS